MDIEQMKTDNVDLELRIRKYQQQMATLPLTDRVVLHGTLRTIERLTEKQRYQASLILQLEAAVKREKS